MNWYRFADFALRSYLTPAISAGALGTTYAAEQAAATTARFISHHVTLAPPTQGECK